MAAAQVAISIALFSITFIVFPPASEPVARALLHEVVPARSAPAKTFLPL